MGHPVVVLEVDHWHRSGSRECPPVEVLVKLPSLVDQCELAVLWPSSWLTVAAVITPGRGHRLHVICIPPQDVGWTPSRVSPLLESSSEIDLHLEHTRTFRVANPASAHSHRQPSQTQAKRKPNDGYMMLRIRHNAKTGHKDTRRSLHSTL